ncbi:hypothetical protein [Rhodococcus sp. IEGM1428]|uniref:hypothetical protein n=1 Tax=Rhodococcus sp. IEGM1428 TaxID=3392191 RepID=UPI003D0F10DC
MDRTDVADADRDTGRQTHDYVRNGTPTLFAALKVATGRVTGRYRPHHRHSEFLVFLKRIARADSDEGLTC